MEIKNKKDVLFITNFKLLGATLDVNAELIKQLSINFENLYFINTGNLLLPKSEEIDKNFDEIKKSSDCFFINPKNFDEFNIFLKNKKALVVSNFGRCFDVIKINFFLKKKKIKIYQVSNLGFYNVTKKYDLKKSILLIIKNFFAVKLFKKISVILSNLGIFPKNEVRFISNKHIYDEIFNSPIKKKLYENKLFFSKKIVLINSKSYDLYKKNLYDISEDYIVHLDKEFDWPELVAFRGKYDKKKLEKHYFYLNNFLAKLSKDFNKKVVICVHPGYDLKKFKNYFPNYEVIQFRTREYIYKSFLVTLIDSSAIVDAILLKKKALVLTSDYMDVIETNYSLSNAKRYGLACFNIEKDFTKSNKIILNEVEKKIITYDNYISDYHCLDKNSSGYEKIIKTLKDSTV